MEVLNAAIEGATADKALKRRSRASFKMTAQVSVWKGGKGNLPPPPKKKVHFDVRIGQG